MYSPCVGVYVFSSTISRVVDFRIESTLLLVGAKSLNLESSLGSASSPIVYCGVEATPNSAEHVGIVITAASL